MIPEHCTTEWVVPAATHSPPSRSSQASWAPVEAPEGTSARKVPLPRGRGDGHKGGGSQTACHELAADTAGRLLRCARICMWEHGSNHTHVAVTGWPGLRVDDRVCQLPGWAASRSSSLVGLHLGLHGGVAAGVKHLGHGKVQRATPMKTEWTVTSASPHACRSIPPDSLWQLKRSTASHTVPLTAWTASRAAGPLLTPGGPSRR